MELHISPDAATAARDAAAFIAKKVWPAVHKRGRFAIAVSGGSTPAPMFAALAAEDLPWGSVHVYQVDERVAPGGDPARNSLQLAVFPVPTLNLHLMEVEWGDRKLAVASYAAAISEQQLDVVHLGLGDDGHTASWPPGDPVVDVKVPVASVGPFNGHERITITPSVVNSARARVVLATGAGKAGVVRRWLDGDPSLPASRVKASSTDVFLDEAAASELPGR